MIEELLSKKQESDLFDIKLEYYKDDRKFELIKDVVSFANCRELGDKYIIFGVENKTFRIKGVDEELPDISEIQSLLSTYVEPSLEIEMDSRVISGKNIKFIRIKNCINKPYVIKKSYSKYGKVELREGELYIRKNATNSIVTRNDIIQMFKEKEKFSIFLKCVNIFSNGISLLIELKNETVNSININKLSLRIIFKTREFVLNKCYTYDKNRNVKNKLCIDKDNSLYINSNSCRVELLYFEMDEKLVNALNENKAEIYLNIKDDKLLNMDTKVEI